MLVSSIRPMRLCASPEPVSAAVTSGRASRWSRASGRQWGMNSLAWSRLSVTMSARSRRGARRFAVPLVGRELRVLPTRAAHCSCLHGGRYGSGDVDGGQGEAVRVPQADGTLVVLPVGADDSDACLVTLTDVMATGHRRCNCSRRAGKDRGCRGRRCSRVVRSNRCQAARRRADHPARPSSRPDRAGRRVRCDGHRQRAR